MIIDSHVCWTHFSYPLTIIRSVCCCNYLTSDLFFYSVYVVLVRRDARKGSALSVPIDEPLLNDAESDQPDDFHDNRIN